MSVIAFAPPEPRLFVVHGGGAPDAGIGAAANRLRLYGRAMRVCFLLVLAIYAGLQIGCLLSLFLHLRSGIVTGSIGGTIAFRFSAPFDYFSPDHALSGAFVPKIFPIGAAIGYALVTLVASAPFCASLLYLAALFDLYAHGEVFTGRTAMLMRRIGHAVAATGYSPLLLGPIAHEVGVLKPLTGLTNGMILFVVVGMVLLAIAHVMDIGHRIQQEQEEIL